MTFETMGLVGLALVVVAIALRIGFTLGRKADDRGDLSGVRHNPVAPPPPRPAATPGASAGDTPQGMTHAQLAEIQRELAAGHKITAIKLYREATGMGLAESKNAVEAMER